MLQLGLTFLLVVAAFLQQPASATAWELQVVEDEAKIEVLSSGRSVIVYNKQSPPVPPNVDPIYRRSGFLHPVTSPAGRVVTATFPADHLHQHGIFSAWVKTSYAGHAIDFWNLAGGTGRVLHDRVVETFHDERSAGFVVDLIHRAELEPPVDVLREQWKVTVYDRDDGAYCFDLETTQHSLTSDPLVVEEYHYGGVALRGPTRWLAANDVDTTDSGDSRREPSRFLNDRGSDRLVGNHEHSRWVGLTGQLDGNDVTVSVLCHAQNFRAPQAARLHPTKPYFCFAPCVDDPFSIDAEHPYHARYRFLVTDAVPDASWIDEQWQQWCPAAEE